jgi:hypothetical protein
VIDPPPHRNVHRPHARISQKHFPNLDRRILYLRSSSEIFVTEDDVQRSQLFFTRLARHDLSEVCTGDVERQGGHELINPMNDHRHEHFPILSHSISLYVCMCVERCVSLLKDLNESIFLSTNGGIYLALQEKLCMETINTGLNVTARTQRAFVDSSRVCVCVESLVKDRSTKMRFVQRVISD